MSMAARIALYIQIGGVEQVRIRGGFQRRDGPVRVALVAPEDIGEDRASSTGCPIASNSSARRRARTSGAAVTKIFTSASGQMTVPMSRPSSTAPGGWRRSRAARRPARRAPRESPRRSRRLRRSPGTLSAISSSWRRIERPRGGNRGGGVVGPMPAVEHGLGHRAIEQAGVEMAQPVMRREPLAERALAGRRRPVDRDDHADESAPSARISSAKPGKLVAMKALSSTRTGVLAREAHHQRRHGDAVIHVGRHHAAAGGRALAVHDQVVALDLDGDAIDAQHLGGRGEPVAFLDPQFRSGRACASCLRQRRRRPRASDIRRSSTARAPPARRRP